MRMFYIRGCRERQISVVCTEHQALTSQYLERVSVCDTPVMVHPTEVLQLLLPHLPWLVVASVVKAADVVIIYLLTH